MAYTIILVDDEDDVRGRIASKMTDRTDFEVIGSASNGYDALDVLEETVPDVVVTDIKMPFVDGIELTRIIRDRYPTVKVAIISGYDDYSYLKEAINLDVVAYLSKPITKPNVDEFLNKIKQTLDSENEHIRMKEHMVVNQVRERVIHHFLGTTNPSSEDLALLSEVDVCTDCTFVLVSARLIDVAGNIIDSEKRRHQSFQLMEELVDDVFKAYHCIYGDDIISIIEVKDAAFDKQLDLLLYKIVGYFDKYLSQSLALGISNQGGFLTMSDLYRQSQVTLEDYGQPDHNSINYYKDLDLVTEKKVLSKEEINNIRHNMRYMSEKDFNHYLTELTKEIKEDHGYDYFSLMIAISGQLIEYADSVGAGARAALDIGMLKDFVEHRSLDSFMLMMAQLRGEIQKELQSRKSQKSMSLMNRIIGYMEDNYQQPDISMERVCEEFNISVSYLSALFRKETDTTFNKYLIRKRIDHAKVLLGNTDNKMVVIAEQCGYRDVYYFSHSFKKTTGTSPKEYRKHAQTQ